MIDRFPPVLLVGFGGFLGAIARFVVSGWFKDVVNFPLGTLIVNVLGSFFLSYMVTMNRFNLFDPTWLIFLGTGFMGSFTTMSTFAVETLGFTEVSRKIGIINILATIAFVFLGALAGQSFAAFQVRRSF